MMIDCVTSLDSGGITTNALIFLQRDEPLIISKQFECEQWIYRAIDLEIDKVGRQSYALFKINTVDVRNP